MTTSISKQPVQKRLADLSLAELQKQLAVTPDGLSQEEARRRLDQYGYNELVEKKANPLLKFLSYFWGPIPWMIEIAVILSAVVGHWADLGIILALLMVNAGVGFWEEYQASNTITALKQTLALQARVKRDEAWSTIPARELVPGDVVRVRIGDIVPADARILTADPVQLDQSALTGESLPVTRGSGEPLYSGAVLKQGEGDALVYATGADTFFGQMAHLAATRPSKSHFQRAVIKIGDYLILVAIVLVILILAVALFRGDNMLTSVQFALVLTVAAIPVAMPTVLSVTMAAGARLLARKQAVVSRLASVEELAGMDVLCSDKTGTLTQNKLTLGTPILVAATDPDKVILTAALSSRAEDQDPIDLAVLGGLSDDQSLTSYRITQFQPFDPVHKRTEASVQGPDGQAFKVTKGAPQVILPLIADADAVQAQVVGAVDDFAARGFRSLAVARTDEQNRWQLLGILPLYDPPREESHDTIQTAQQMGIDVKMVTGDQVAIAREIGRQLELGANILDAGLFQEADVNKAGHLAEAIETADGFAQVFPEHKYRIVETLQQHGHIVGMTGDGVNDAPALKRADVGVAVSGATDAARSAADIVLLTSGLCVIIDAVKESRRIFKRMNSYATYRIAETIRVLLFMTLSILVFDFYPVTAVMIVLLALLNDGAILSIACDRAHYSDEPERWDMPQLLGIATVLGVMGVFSSFGMFYLGERVLHLSREVIQSLMYLKLSVAGHLTILITRTRGPFWSFRPAPLLLGAVLGTQLLATLIAVYGVFMAPLGWTLALLVWGYALVWFVVNDLVKVIACRIFDRNAPGLLEKRR
jgi:H+-transporting ATPase